MPEDRFPTSELVIYENRDKRLCVRMTLGDLAPIRTTLTALEAVQLVDWLHAINRRVADEAR